MRSLTARRASRRRRNALRWALRVGVPVLVAALVGGGVWLVRFSSVLDLRTVRVEVTAGQTGAGAATTRVLTDAAIVEAAAVPMGAPLAGVDTKAIAKRVGVLKPVASVTVSQRLPHTLVIKVQERSATFAAKHGGSYALVDAGGVAFHTVGAAPKGLVVATVRSLDPRLLGGVASVVAALPDALRARLTGVRADSPELITLTLDKHITVVWGSSEQSAVKVEVAAVLLKVKDVRVIDVSAPGNPTTRT